MSMERAAEVARRKRAERRETWRRYYVAAISAGIGLSAARDVADEALAADEARWAEGGEDGD